MSSAANGCAAGVTADAHSAVASTRVADWSGVPADPPKVGTALAGGPLGSIQ